MNRDLLPSIDSSLSTALKQKRLVQDAQNSTGSDTPDVRRCRATVFPKV